MRLKRFLLGKFRDTLFLPYEIGICAKECKGRENNTHILAKPKLKVQYTPSVSLSTRDQLHIQL